MRYRSILILALVVVSQNQLWARKWTDRSGKHQVEAELVEVRQGKVQLRRNDGKLITLDMKALSAADQAFLQKQVAAPPGPEEHALDASFVTPDFFAAVYIRPQQLIRSPVLKRADVKNLLQSMFTGAGFPIDDAREVVFLIAPPNPHALVQSPSGIFRLSKPVNVKELVETVLPQGAQKQLGDKSYYMSSIPSKMTAIHLPDPQTVIITNEPLLKRMIAAKPGRSPLIEQLLRTDRRGELIAVFVVDEKLVDFSGVVATLPPEFAAFRSVPEKLRAAVLRVDLSSDQLLQLELHGNDAASAADLEQMAVQLLAFARQTYAQMRPQINAGPAQTGAMLDAAMEMLEGAAVKRMDDVVQVTIGAPENLDKVLKVLELMEPDQESDDAARAEEEPQVLRTERFQVQFPREPERVDSQLPIGGRKVQATVYGGVTRGAEYLLMTYELPEGAAGDADEQLLAVQAKVIQNNGGKLGESRRVELQDSPGREFSFTATRDGRAFESKARMLLRDNRLYILSVISKTVPPDAKTFFDSFKFIAAEE